MQELSREVLLSMCPLCGITTVLCKFGQRFWLPHNSNSYYTRYTKLAKSVHLPECVDCSMHKVPRLNVQWTCT